MLTTTDSAVVSAPQRFLSRRGLLGGLAGLGAIAAMPGPAQALAGTREWRLAIRNVHTNESVDALFARNGQFVPEGLAELNHGLRDWRTGEATVMDRKLLALLVSLRRTLDVGDNRKIDLISGYRSPKTNAGLRARGGQHTGVASQSQHMLGKATDIMVPGVSLDRLHGAALALGGGGVGFYPRDGFVHVDTGRVRHW
ncbi:DUF882 domain-containing protein [Sphingomonas populi]|uniref:Murein endopeptidase K n=1 Tax=Sphingomonas populi TaxID=2484750 RepID=A0A4Q6XY25_9SPHN|nr:DUF882 domain-containing protein [Sphingomonas populi]RZF64881.1 DUF882 domain-containing protein [Sphingomonas populi]